MSILSIIIGVIAIFSAAITAIISNSGVPKGFYEVRDHIFTIALCIIGILLIILGAFVL